MNNEKKATELAQEQLDAYNVGDIERFLHVYADDVVVMEFPSQHVMYKGKEGMRERYTQLFNDNPNNHAELLNRVVKGNIVIDHEFVTGRENGIELYAVAMYEIIDDKIKHVWFVK
ncbi:nuclear transport factor 2 family protein [Alkalihalobacillus sp. LMS39]|uniref:nuclear transport factor 2 family protein n=1 Tax=Alkalihalobacillus sp. LMS39 TaxID=2924032 RepID=UPI001FB1B62C|nr:nuclear transport factor 2 family protein [Alkalihalobacillus sp. LMS39]UOE94861.1 nuclear transport factor 2 family protein [Alkalihalobacillus sp. LMS39]